MSLLSGQWANLSTNILDDLKKIRENQITSTNYSVPKRFYMTAEQAILAFEYGLISPFDSTIQIMFGSSDDCQRVTEFLKTFSPKND